MAKEKWIGLSLGVDTDWPSCFEAMMERLKPAYGEGEDRYELKVRRILMDPFFLRDESKYVLVVDRLTHWFKLAREWLKKAALMNDVYLLNNPFTFQSMEKHSAFCAMMRLGLKIPETALLPQKEYPEDSPIYEKTAQRYNLMFDIDEVAERVGYPLYMKPYDGGGWRGVSRIENSEQLHSAYDDSGMEIMHLQKAVDPYEVFVRSLTIGPQVLPMRYDPEQPLHLRYQLDDEFLSPKLRREMCVISKAINAFFRWEYNSCEALLRGDNLHPIDFANACPDSALTSLHRHFPFVTKALLLWTNYCVFSERKMRKDLEFDSWYSIADNREFDYDEKLNRYEKLADEYFETEKFQEFCHTHFSDLDAQLLDFFSSDQFDAILVTKVRDVFPKHEHDHYIEHYRELLRGGVEHKFGGKAS